MQKKNWEGPKVMVQIVKNPQHLAIFPHEKNSSQVNNLIQWRGFARMITRLDLRLRSLAKSDRDKNKTHKTRIGIHDPWRSLEEEMEEEFFANQTSTQASFLTKPHLSYKHSHIHKKFLLAQNFGYMEVSQVLQNRVWQSLPPVEESRPEISGSSEREIWELLLDRVPK